MKTSLRLTLALLPLVAAGSLFAQTPTTATDSSGPRRGHGPRGNPVIRALDTDHNHEISASELANAPVVIRALDTNGDGTVSAAELRPARPADAPERPAPPADAPNRPRPTDPVMLALDANEDGALSAAEINNAATSLAALDANKDGKLTLDEVRPLPPEGATAGEGAARGSRPPRS